MFAKKQPAILKTGKLRLKKQTLMSPEFEEETPEESDDGNQTSSDFQYGEYSGASFEPDMNTVSPIIENYSGGGYYMITGGKPSKILDEKKIYERLSRCKMADVKTLTCLADHCRRTFKECLTLAFHLSYSHIGDARPMLDSVCLLCGKLCTNGRSLSLHAHLSHRDVSTRHSDEMRAMSRLIDCHAATNKERMQNLMEKSKMFELPDIVFPEKLHRRPNSPRVSSSSNSSIGSPPTTLTFPTSGSSASSTGRGVGPFVDDLVTSTTSKTRVFNLPLKRYFYQEDTVAVTMTSESTEGNSDNCGYHQNQGLRTPNNVSSYHHQPETSGGQVMVALPPLHEIPMHSLRRRDEHSPQIMTPVAHSNEFCSNSESADEALSDEILRQSMLESSCPNNIDLTQSPVVVTMPQLKITLAELERSNVYNNVVVNNGATTSSRKRTISSESCSFDNISYYLSEMETCNRLTKRVCNEQLILDPNDAVMTLHSPQPLPIHWSPETD